MISYKFIPKIFGITVHLIEGFSSLRIRNSTYTLKISGLKYLEEKAQERKLNFNTTIMRKILKYYYSS